jgi:HAD superfamily hydrolase (TIGR01509 family)
MNVQAVIFDIDGTLVDSNEQHVTAWAFAFREAGYPQEVEDIRRQIGKGGDQLLPALLPDVAEPIRNRIADSHGRYFKDMYLNHVHSFEGATELVAKVHASGRRVALASSAKRDEIEHYVELLGIGDYLAATTSIDDVDASKPAPDIFGVALEKIGLSGEQAIVVGDTPYDVEAALKAGVAAVGVTSGPFDALRLKEAGAVAVYSNVGELLDAFDRSPLAE